MIVDRSSKVVTLGLYDLEMGFTCPDCGHTYYPNGTGPQSSGILSKLLRGLPSELIVGGLPARFHDAAYLMCPNGWTVRFVGSGRTFEAKDKASADRAYFDLAMWQHKDSGGIARAMLWTICKRNYLSVKLGGKSSYRHKH